MPNNKHTRTPNGSGSIRKRPDGRWEGRFSNGFDPITGKQVQHSVYGKTQKEVRQKISKITNEIDEKTYIDSCTMTLNEWIDIWLADYTISLKDSTAYNYERAMALHVRPTLGHIRLDQLDGRIKVEKSRIILCRFLSNCRLVSIQSLSNPVELSNLVERSMSNSVEGSNKDRIALSNVVELP